MHMSTSLCVTRRYKRGQVPLIHDNQPNRGTAGIENRKSPPPLYCSCDCNCQVTRGNSTQSATASGWEAAPRESAVHTVQAIRRRHGAEAVGGALGGAQMPTVVHHQHEMLVTVIGGTDTGAPRLEILRTERDTQHRGRPTLCNEQHQRPLAVLSAGAGPMCTQYTAPVHRVFTRHHHVKQGPFLQQWGGGGGGGQNGKGGTHFWRAPTALDLPLRGGGGLKPQEAPTHFTD